MGNLPQGLKPLHFPRLFGMAEALPFHKAILTDFFSKLRG